MAEIKKALNIQNVSKCYLCNIKIAPPKHLCGDCHEDSINKCSFDCDNPVYKDGASYCDEHMKCDDWT